MGLTLLEQETVITFNREESEMEIYTFDPKLIRIFTKFAQEHPDLCRHDEAATEFHPHIFTLDKGLVSIRPKRVYTDEEREAMRQKAIAAGRKPPIIRPKQAQEE